MTPCHCRRPASPHPHLSKKGFSGTYLAIPQGAWIRSVVGKLRSRMPLVTMRVAQLCPTLCDPGDYTVHGVLQARILEWVAIPFSRGSSQSRDQTLQADSLPAEPQGIGHGQKKSLFLPSPSPSRLGTDGDSSQGGVPSPF